MSAKEMNTALEKKSGWRGEPMVWLLIALPIAAVLASLTTMWIASRNADTLVKEEYVKEGLAIRQAGERDLKAAGLGLAGALAVQPGRMALTLTGRLEAMPERLTLTMVHPTDPAQDRVVLLESDAPGRYSAVFTELPDTRRRLELMPADKAWRLAGLWQPPISESIPLAPSTQVSSTQQPSTQP
jgi:hypothetical protein